MNFVSRWKTKLIVRWVPPTYILGNWGILLFGTTEARCIPGHRSPRASNVVCGESPSIGANHVPKCQFIKVIKPIAWRLTRDRNDPRFFRVRANRAAKKIRNSRVWRSSSRTLLVKFELVMPFLPRSRLNRVGSRSATRDRSSDIG